MAGHFFRKPSTQNFENAIVGIYDASYGSLLKGDGKGGFVTVNEQQSGILVEGQARDVTEINPGKKRLAIFAMNNQAPKLFTIDKPVKKKCAVKDSI